MDTSNPNSPDLRSSSSRDKDGRDKELTTALSVHASPRLERPIAIGMASGGSSEWLHAFRRRWFLALSLSVTVGAGAAAAAWCLWQPEYTAVATLRIASHQPMMLAGKHDGSDQSFEVYKKTQQELIRDRLVLSKALNKPAVAQLPIVKEQIDEVSWLQKEITVSFPADAEILHISMRGPDPEATKELVNAVCNAYLEQVVFKERFERKARLEALEQLEHDAEEKVLDQRSKLKDLTETFGTGDAHAATLKQQIALEDYASMRKEHSSIQLQLMREQAKLAVLEARVKSLDKDEVPPDAVESQIKLQPEYAAAADAVEKLRQALHGAENVVVNGQERLTEKYRRELATAQQKLDDLHSQLKPAIEAEFERSMTQQAKVNLAATEAEVSTLLAEEQELKKQVDALEGDANSIGRSSVKLEMTRSELESMEGLRKQLASEVESLRIELDSKTSKERIEVISPADVSRLTDVKGRWRQTGMMAVVGFFVPLFCVCWSDARRKKINSAREVSGALGLQIIGTMPLIPPRAHRRLTGQSGQTIWNRLFTESIDSIRETLLSERRSRALKVVLISSATGGEGKTTVATQLAKSFARTGQRTVLVDCDLRCPATQRVFNESPDEGLADVLYGTHSIDEVTYPTSEPHLYHLPAGGIRNGVQEQLGRSRAALADIFQHLREQFEIVLVDSSPILPVVDTLVIGQFADAAVMSIMRDVSHSHEILEAQSRLERIGVPVLGAIVTSNVSSIYGSSYRYGYVLQG
jgi:succinoglycan biosynthesis transport protein ExoP